MNISKLLINFAYLINLIIPKNQNRIIFYSSPDYSDNCRTLYEKITSCNKNNRYSFIWVVKDVNSYRWLNNDKCKVVKHRSLQSLWYYCRSKYIFRTHSFWDNKYVKKRQIMCVAWHGMPIKKIAVSNRPLSENRPCDYLISTSSFFDKELADAVGTSMDSIVHTGLPRNDDLYKKVDIYTILGIKKCKRIIIWMPTFRQRTDGAYCDGKETVTGVPLCNYENLNTLNEALLNKEYFLVIKPHPWAEVRINSMQYSNIRVITDQDIPKDISLYSLVGNTDALITDYSSISVDYLLVDKPISFVMDDIEDYRKDRGFIAEPIENYLPGEKLHTFKDLLQWIQSLEQENYSEERKRIQKLFFYHSDFRSSERLLKLMGLL